MSSISIADIQADLQGFLRRVESGEPLMILRDNRAIAEVKPVDQPADRRPFGLCAGEFEVPADFDAPLPDSVLQAFEGK
jgi:antitoxin (DNA-binding transcriptional repressor) of toxin-antitoxin stability system